MVSAPKKNTNNVSVTTRSLVAVGGIAVFGMLGIGVMGFSERPVAYERDPAEQSAVAGTSTQVLEVQVPAEALIVRGEFAATYLPTPVPLKGIYMSQCVVGTPSFREELVRLIDETELNAVVIDVKDYTGGIAFPSENPVLAPYHATHCGAYDMRDFLAYLKEKDIYTIARITVFQDPLYAEAHPEDAVKKASDPTVVWRDHKGLNFIDVSARPFWEYIVELSRETHKIGFDELNFDYVRFPSDGPMHDISFPHSGDIPRDEALEHFFAYLNAELSEPSHYPHGVPRPVLSADLFGFTTSNSDDLSIGQVLERAVPYFDYLMPMVYPSHYPHGSFGFDNPNNNPYGIINRAMSDGVRRVIAESTIIQTLDGKPIYETRVIPAVGTSTPERTEDVPTGRYTKEVYDKNVLRPWLQDFKYGGDYDATAIAAQIKGSEDAGLHSWIFWDPGNKYRSLRQVVEVGE